jgi:TolB-like protein/Flp pilus assembly protein TadD
MKHCPTCRQTYTDETLKFCRVDGALLISDSLPTKILQNRLPGSSPSTLEMQPQPRPRSARRAVDSLAILPFDNDGFDSSMEYFSDGITESIINTLAQLPKLRVVPRSTVFRYKGSKVNPQEVGRELGARLVLTGRVHQTEDYLLISAELMDVENDSQLWGERYNRPPSDIFAVQEEIAAEISEKLRLKLSGAQKKQLTKRHTANAEAYRSYLKGRFYWNKRTGEGIRKAIEYFTEAIEEDANYALAYVGLADSYILSGIFGEQSPGQSMPKARLAASKAVEIDSTLAEAHTSLGYVKAFYDWDWMGAEKEFSRATKLNSAYPIALHFYSFYLAAMGRLDEALAAERQAQELDPVSLIVSTNIGRYLYYARLFDQAIEQSLTTLQMDPDFPPARITLSLALEQKGLHEEAIAHCQRAVANSGGDLALESLGHACASAGKRTEALALVRELTEKAKQRYVSPYHMAVIYLGLGEKDEAFAWLENAFQDRTLWLVFVKVDPRFDAIRSDPRFEDLVRHVGL